MKDTPRVEFVYVVVREDGEFEGCFYHTRAEARAISGPFMRGEKIRRAKLTIYGS